MYLSFFSFLSQFRQWTYLSALVDTSQTYGNSRWSQAGGSQAVQEGCESLEAGGRRVAVGAAGETHIPASLLQTLPEKRNRPILQIAASSYVAGMAG